MKKEIFGIPIFEDKVDVTKFDIIPKAPLEPTWDSGVPSTFSSQKTRTDSRGYMEISI